MKVVSISAQSMRLQDASLGSVVQIGSFNYVKIAENKYMQSTEVTCPDGVTVGGKYVKCFEDEDNYELSCLSFCKIYNGSGNCDGRSVDFDYTGTIQSFTVPVDGMYKLEVWGAQGGNRIW